MYSDFTRNKAMRMARQHPPVILLLGEKTAGNNSFDEWLAQSRYSALEAVDVFQVLEHVSDFTQRQRPDVVYLHVDSVEADVEFMQTLVATAVGQPDVPIIDFADNSKGDRVQFEE